MGPQRVQYNTGHRKVTSVNESRTFAIDKRFIVYLPVAMFHVLGRHIAIHNSLLGKDADIHEDRQMCIRL